MSFLPPFPLPPQDDPLAGQGLPGAGLPGMLPPGMPMGGPPQGAPGMPPLDPMMMDTMMMDPSMMGMPGQPPMGPEMPPPPPPPEEDPDYSQTPYAIIMSLLRELVAAGQDGVMAAREVLSALRKKERDQLLVQAEFNPDDAEFLALLLPQQNGPVYPKWFTIPPKPTEEDIIELAERDRTEWSEVRYRIDEDLKLLHVEQSATYPDFDEDTDQPYVSSAMSDEVRAIASMVGSTEPSYEVKYQRPDIENATQMAEDALYHWDDMERQAHMAAGNGPFHHDVALYLVSTGYVAWRVAIDPEGGDQWFRSTLVNPATVVPVWDERGLLRVTRHYADTVANIISDFDGDGEVEKILLGAQNPMADRPFRLTDQMSVVTYHDRYWFAVLADDICIIKPTAHKYGFVPYVIQGSGLGEPQQIHEFTNDTTPQIGGTTKARNRLKYKNVSYFHFRRRMHAQKEMVMSKLMTLWGKADRPAWLIYQDEFAEASGTPAVDDRPGKINPLKMNHEQLQPLVSTQAAPQLFQPLVGAIGQDDLTNRLSPAFFGMSDSANQSGNALEGLYEAGKDKMAVYVNAVEGFYSERASMLLRLWRDWGQIMETDDGDFGVQVVPYGRRRQRINGSNEPTFHLTPETIRRTGVRVRASLVHMRLQNLGPLGNAASIWMQIGGMSAREAMELRGVRNPDEVLAERRYEEVMLDEDLKKLVVLKELREKDPELAFLYEQMIQKNKASEQGGAPGAPQMPGNFNPSPNTSAIDLSALGLGPGGPTGRPPGMGLPPGPGSVAIPPGGGPPTPLGPPIM